jgi:DNA-binding protein H-NS
MKMREVVGAFGSFGKLSEALEELCSEGIVAGAGAHKGQRKGLQAAKYPEPKTGATWSGKGPAPAWLAVAKDRSKFLIGGADAGSSDAGSANLAGKKATAKKIAAKKL